MKMTQLCSDLVMCPLGHLENGQKLIDILNPIELIYFEKYGEMWKPTNGYRFMAEHVRIYKEINERRKKAKKKPLPIPLGSQHLKFNAVDVYDPKGNVKHFVGEYLHLFEAGGIYFEAFSFTQDWVHMQDVAPKSGNRFFIPF